MLNIVQNGHTVLSIGTAELKRSPVLPLLLLLYITPPEERDALIAHLLGSASSNPEDMAEALGVKPSTVVKRMQRCRSTLDKLLRSGASIRDGFHVVTETEEDDDVPPPRRGHGDSLWGMGQWSLGR